MGQAARRGTFEQRREQSLRREQERVAAIEAAQERHRQQEIDAYRTMVWWQIDLSEERHRKYIRAIQQRRAGMNVLMASVLAMAACH